MTEIYVEVVPRGTPTGDLAPRITVPEHFAKRVGEIGDTLTEIAKKLGEKLEDVLTIGRGNSWKLEEVELNFSLDLQSEAGVIIARASAKAGFEASLTWKAPAEGKSA